MKQYDQTSAQILLCYRKQQHVLSHIETKNLLGKQTALYFLRQSLRVFYLRKAEEVKTKTLIENLAKTKQLSLFIWKNNDDEC